MKSDWIGDMVVKGNLAGIVTGIRPLLESVFCNVQGQVYFYKGCSCNFHHLILKSKVEAMPMYLLTALKEGAVKANRARIE